MMDHARHLSSPSPTSPFLFHHSERTFKSASLMPLLSSSADSVDDCFSTSSMMANQNEDDNPYETHHHQDNQHHNLHSNHHGNQIEQEHQQQDLNQLQQGHQQHSTAILNDNGISNTITTASSNNLGNIISNDDLIRDAHSATTNTSTSRDGHHQSSTTNNGSSACVISSQDSLTGVDDDDDDVDGMHNMLSGSSPSSASTMPLLSEAHSRHSFSRISLGEYSPLSLVEDCDAALPISPTSLAACGSFKSTLNGCLKMDPLVGDVDHDHDGVHDDVNDTRSMSPSLMSASGGSNHLWSNSSTAITQNPNLLTSSSTSFLLSQHHHHHLNSFMQQLEPQSLDEPPSLVNGVTGVVGTSGRLHCVSNGFETSSNLLMMANRPSSEPPPGAGDLSDSISLQGSDIKSLNGIGSTLNTNHVKAKQPASRSRSKSNGNNNSGGAQTSAANIVSPPRNRNRSRSNATNRQQNSMGLNDSQTSSLDTDGKSSRGTSNGSQGTQANQISPAHNSKVHLQLNHQKKLQELQQRLFGESKQSDSNALESTRATASASTTVATRSAKVVASSAASDKLSTNREVQTRGTSSRKNPSSEANNLREDRGAAFKVPAGLLKQEQPDSSDKIAESSSSGQNAHESGESAAKATATKGRPPRSRRSRTKNSNSNASANGNANSSTLQANTIVAKSNQKVVKTETAEPDTTTKTSDCIKLADLLANTASSESPIIKAQGNFSFVNGLGATISEPTDADQQQGSTGEAKKVQQIQLQVSPSLTVLANGNLMQQIGVQQQQGAVITTTGANFANQIICRPQTVVAAGNQLKGFVTAGNVADSKSCEVNTWSTNGNLNGQAQQQQQQQSQNNPGLSSVITANGQTIGTHQIAIQVIGLDGTSLVLPVSSASGLNAVSLTSQSPQLQAIFNGSNNGSALRGNQILPVMSVSNFVSQPQQQSNSNGSSTNSQGTNITGGVNQTSGLAASSPTLAALLDAGTGRCSAKTNGDLTTNINGTNIVSANLLRKFVSANAGEFKRGDTITIQPGSTLGLSSCGSLVTLCTPNNVAQLASQLEANKMMGISTASGEKRIRLDTNVGGSTNATSGADLNNIQTATFTLIDPQGLIVATGNEQESNGTVATSKAVTKQGIATSHIQAANIHGNIVVTQQQQQATSNAPTHLTTTTTTTVKTTPDVANKQTKSGASTGNRQVDPTQPFRCEHCNSTFTRLGNFTRHKKIHTVPTKDGQRFKCDVCSKSFLQRCDLARHLHIHRGTEPHRCNICGKGYIRHSDLVTHQRFHNKEKPFGCPHCSKGFCQRGDLNRHLRSIHLQMKPILCPCCNKKFAKQETLLRHLNAAHRNRPGTIATTPTTTATTTTVMGETQPATAT